MTVEFMQKLSIIFFIIAGVFLILGIVLFFILDIPKIYGFISGKTAKKAIEKIRQQNKNKFLIEKTICFMETLEIIE